MDYKNLKSGTDVRGVALDAEGEKIDLTDEAVKAIVSAFVYWLSKKLNKTELKIAVGHDSRLSSDRIKEAAIVSLKAAGGEIFDCELASTPSMFMMTQFDETKCDGAIMITASHLPYTKNGLKFFTSGGGLESEDISQILTYAEEEKCISGNKTQLFRKNFMKLYSSFLVEKVKKETNEQRPLSGLKIVVDAGNGAGGFFASEVLAVLGADTSGSQFLQPDGHFPNHMPNPEQAEAMQSIKKCVLDNKADIGIIFDTDVDRAAIVASDGMEINRNRLIALISAIILEENRGATIVTDSVTSDGLNKFITEKGGVHHRFKRGYRNVINEAIRLEKEGKNVPLAIETSGHAALKENFFLDDGAYLAVRILISMAKLNKQGKALSGLIETLELPKEQQEVRMGFKCENWKELGGMILEKLHDFSSKNFSVALSNYEGIRANVSFAYGWFLARMSVHDPILIINMESMQAGGVKTMARLLFAFMKAFSGLDSSNLEKLVNN